MASDKEKSASRLLDLAIASRIDGYSNEQKTDWFSTLIYYLARPFINYRKFSTTIRGRTIYWEEDSEEDLNNREWWTFKVKAHEAQHMIDAKDRNLLFYFCYMLPHILAVPVLGAYITLTLLGDIRVQYHLGSLGSILLFATPVLNYLGASYMRTYFELRAYTISLGVNYWKYGFLKKESIDETVAYFTGSQYFFMMPYEKLIRRLLDKELSKLYDGSLLKTNKWAKQVYAIMKLTEIAYVGNK